MHVLIVVASIRYPLHKRHVKFLLKSLTRLRDIIAVGFIFKLVSVKINLKMTSTQNKKYYFKDYCEINSECVYINFQLSTIKCFQLPSEIKLFSET